MHRNYSVFLENVGSCKDRFCTVGYDREYSLKELFDHVADIPKISAVDIVLTAKLCSKKDELRYLLNETGLAAAAIMPDLTGNPIYKQGALCALNPQTRAQAIQYVKDSIDFASSVNCKNVTLWLGQDGYDYLFQADYIHEHSLLQESIYECCMYRPDITITLEYKPKEPRTHLYLNTIGTTLLTIEKIGAPNLGVALDYGHAAYAGESPAEVVGLCKLYENRLKHIHINDNYLDWDHDMIAGSVHTLNYIEFFYWLHRTNYTGYISMDLYPYREDGQAAVRESVLWVDALERLAYTIDPVTIETILKTKDAIAANAMLRKLLLNA